VTDHLRKAIIYFVLWLAVLLAELGMYKQFGSLGKLLQNWGDMLSFLIVVCISIFLLALALRSFFLHIRAQE